MIRLIVAFLWAALGMLFCLPIHWHNKHIGKTDPVKCWTKSKKLVSKFFRALIFIAGTKIEIRGEENLPDADHAALFVSNHQSYFDIIILQTLVKGNIGFVAKKEFRSYPLLPLFMEDMGSIFLDRDNARESLKTISEGTERMKKGLSLGLYPEGTRNHTDQLLPFKPGGYRMAEKSGCPIIAVAETNFGKIFEENPLHFIRSRHVIIEFAKPVYPGQMDKNARKEYYDSIPAQIQAMLDNHKATMKK